MAELEEVGVDASARRAGPAVTRESEAGPVPADPDVVLVVDGDPVIGKRPDIFLRGAAPGVDQIAFGIELENSAVQPRHPGRGFIEAGFGPGGERWESTVDDEHVILRIDSHADGRAKIQWFGSGLGQKGSTSKAGASTAWPWAASGTAWPTPMPETTATSEVPRTSARVLHSISWLRNRTPCLGGGKEYTLAMILGSRRGLTAALVAGLLLAVRPGPTRTKSPPG